MKSILCFIFLLTALTFVYGQEKTENSGLPWDAGEELENVSYSGGQLSGFAITGTGILTAKPDNVYVQFTVKSGPSVNLKAAEIDVTRKIEFLIRGICREFKLKKENFAVSNAGTQVQERTRKGVSADDQFDEEGNRIAKKSYSNTAKKTVVINNLGGKKQTEVMDILDAAAKYGGTPVANADAEETATESVSDISQSLAQSRGVKGATSLKMTENIQNPSNQLINYHMNEETLKKLLKDTKGCYCRLTPQSKTEYLPREATPP
ncbi:MAG: hypothetical protein V1752_04480 [Candidatus Firestonebacteria bacterium]